MKIAVFYHAKITGKEFGIDYDFSVALLAEQMKTLADCGLLERADYFMAGFNEDPETVKQVLHLMPKKCQVISHGSAARSELPTMYSMQQWINSNPDAHICYFHAKGITHPGDALNRAWRLCLEYSVLWNWRACVLALKSGCDSAGSHWLTRDRFGAVVKTFFWGGNVWWANSSFLRGLPPLSPNSKCREQDFEAELWIGTGRRPVVKDFAPHWPRLDLCQSSANRRNP